MLDLILKFLNIKTCNHPNVATNKILSYCPDCGKLIHINWYIIRCSCCGKKRIGFLRGDKAIPIARFCTNCGTESYIVEKIDTLSYFDINFAIAKKEVEIDTNSHNITQSWIDERDILENLRCLPQHLN